VRDHTGDSSIRIARPAHVSRIRARGEGGEKLRHLTPPQCVSPSLREASGDVADNRRIRAGDAFARLSRVGERRRGAGGKNGARAPRERRRARGRRGENEFSGAENRDRHAVCGTHLLAVAKLDVPLDDATVIHHCGGLAPLPRRCPVTALSLPRSIAPHDRATAARHHSAASRQPRRPSSSLYRAVGTDGRESRLRHRPRNHAAKSILPSGSVGSALCAFHLDNVTRAPRNA